MEVAKTFERDGVRYRPGDPLPPNLDKPALEHYKRYGMVREAKPSETKPIAPRQRKPAEPKQPRPTPPAAAPVTSTGEQSLLSDAVHTSEQSPNEQGLQDAQAQQEQGEEQSTDSAVPVASEQPEA